MKPESSEAGKPDDAETGLPALHTWPKVYLFVVVCFATYVVLLVGLEVAFR